MSHEGLIDCEAAAPILGIQPATCRKWCREGRLPYVALGDRCYKFYKSELLIWIDQHRRGAPKPEQSAKTKERQQYR